jgi:hypothetical protein
MDRTLTRINEIADRACPDREKVNDYFVAILDTQVAELIRADNENPGQLRRDGFHEIADALSR